MSSNFLKFVLQENALEFEARVVAQFDALIRLLEERKAKLLEMINASVQEKGKILRTQSDLCREKMKSTSGLLQYTLEVLKENDAATFLMVRNETYTYIDSSKDLDGSKKSLNKVEMNHSKISNTPQCHMYIYIFIFCLLITLIE